MRIGFCWLEVNKFGPLHWKVVPLEAVNCKVPPIHAGLLLLADAVAELLTLTVCDAVAVQPAALVTVTR